MKKITEKEFKLQEKIKGLRKWHVYSTTLLKVLQENYRRKNKLNKQGICKLSSSPSTASIRTDNLFTLKLFSQQVLSNEGQVSISQKQWKASDRVHQNKSTNKITESLPLNITCVKKEYSLPLKVVVFTSNIYMYNIVSWKKHEKNTVSHNNMVVFVNISILQKGWKYKYR